MILVSSKIFRKNFQAITLYPFIVLREKHLKQDKILLNHERIHLKQQAELLIVPFYIWYLTEYYIRLLKTKNADTAYRMICFEQEAYSNDHNLDYIKSRKAYAFIKYLK